MKKYSHWFYTNSEQLRIWAYALGDHPSSSYHFEDKEDFDLKIKAFLEDGFEFIKDQSK